MNWKRIIWIIAGFVLIAAFIIKLRSNKETATERVYHYDKEQAINVQVEVIELEEINANLSYTGTFEPNKESKISAETQGKINAVLVEEGSIVNKGQSLVQLDNSLLELQLQAVEVQIEGLEADVKRYTILAQSDAIQGVQLEKTILGLKSAMIQKATLLEQINKTTIRAPFSGIVTMKFTEVGAFAAPGVPLLQLTDLSQLKFTINTSENELDHFQKGGSYHVYADIYPDQLLAGKATLIGSKANMGGSYPIQITVKNLRDYKIKAGMFGSINVKEEAGRKGILVPSSAVVGTTVQPQVYVVRDGKAILQDIVVSSKIQGKPLVDRGVSEGDTVVVTGLINLFDGANVTFN